MLGHPITPGTARALVTGASSGIGAAYAVELASLGYDVILVARSRQRLAEVAERVEEHGVTAIVLVADLSTTAGLELVLERVANDSRLNIVVNSAGTASWGPTVELDPDQEQSQIDVNVTAAHRITLAAAREMRARGRGGIVNVASMSAFVSQPYTATYCGTKAFLENFSESLHEELRGTGVVVQALCPGFTRSGIFTTVGANAALIPSYVWLDAADVVRRSLADLRRGRAISVPGLRYRLALLFLRVTPRWGARRFMAKMLGRFDTLRLPPRSAPAMTPDLFAEAARPARSAETKSLETVR